MGDGDAAARAEGDGGDLEACGGLLALVFGGVDEAEDAADGGVVEARFFDDGGGVLVALDVAFDDLVEDVVGREGVLVGLVGAEFGAGGLIAIAKS